MSSGIQIQLLGARFSIQTDQDPEYMRRVIAYVEDRIHEIEKTVATKDPLRTAILASVLVVDELFQLQDTKSRESYSVVGQSRQAEEMAEAMIRRIDSVLSER